MQDLQDHGYGCQDNCDNIYLPVNNVKTTNDQGRN